VIQNPIDNPSPVVGLLIVLGAVDEKNSDDRQGDDAKRRNEIEAGVLVTEG
jgi:hypothetical protein